MKLFKYDNANEQLTLNVPELLLIKEFAALVDEERNKCKEDKGGKSKIRAYKEFAYIYLFYDWESPLSNEIENERHLRALVNSGLTDLEFEDNTFQIACKEYDRLQNSAIAIRLLKSAMTSVETVIFYLQNVDVNERNPLDGKPIIKTKDLIAEIKGCKDLVVGIEELEKQVKKGIESDTGLRGNTEAGFFDLD